MKQYIVEKQKIVNGEVTKTERLKIFEDKESAKAQIGRAHV